MKIKSKDELLVKSFVQTVSSATSFSKRYKKVCRLLDLRPQFSEDQWLRVWRGLYYSIWYSEMTKGCDILAQRIGTHEDIAMIYTGFKSLTNDWFGIDAFRLDKYMFLVRIMINNCLKLQINQLMSNRSTKSDSNEIIDSKSDEQKNESENELNSQEIEEEVKPIETVVTEDETKISSLKKSQKLYKKFDKQKEISDKIIEFPVDFKAKIMDNILMIIKASIGLTLHITDIFIDEFVKYFTDFRVNSNQKIDLYFDLLLPFIRLIAVSEDYRVLNSIKHNVFDKFKNEVLINESIDSRKRLLQRLLDAMIAIGGVEDIGRRNRDVIYDIIGIFKTKLNQLNKTNDNRSLKRKKILIGRGRHKKVKYELTSSSPFVTSIVPIAVI